MAKLIAQYQDGEEMQLFALIKEAAAKTTSAGKPYLALTLADASGEISGMRWDAAPKDIAELQADLSRRERVARGVYVVLMVAMLLLCLGLSWQAFHEHRLARQALEDAQKERSIFEQERQKQEEIQREQERRKQAVIADVNAIYDREEQRLNKIIRHEKYRELATAKFITYNRYQVLADSLNRVYPASDAIISYLCNTIWQHRYNICQYYRNVIF